LRRKEDVEEENQRSEQIRIEHEQGKVREEKKTREE